MKIKCSQLIVLGALASGLSLAPAAASAAESPGHSFDLNLSSGTSNSQSALALGAASGVLPTFEHVHDNDFGPWHNHDHSMHQEGKFSGDLTFRV
jgi:hypothetical protein